MAEDSFAAFEPNLKYGWDFRRLDTFVKSFNVQALRDLLGAFC